MAITGFEADPDEVTELLQLEPTSTARRGTPSRSGRIHQFNGWWLEAHAAAVTSGSQQDAALRILLNHLQGKEACFVALRDRLKPQQVAIYGGFYVSPVEQGGVWLEASQMQALAACGVAWGLDLFVAKPTI
ncbi:MAG TPA: DUF4279 domain-containing protein [Caulobacteraceae bacterium]|nr:DUF4279 domain-containing protein [Caulobacteraceae bacterium]